MATTKKGVEYDLERMTAEGLEEKHLLSVLVLLRGRIRRIRAKAMQG